MQPPAAAAPTHPLPSPSLLSLAVEKFHFLENDINVPFYVRGPGVAPGSTSPALVSQVDLGTTMLDLAGVAPLPTDGRSFAAALAAADGAGAARDRLVVEYFGGGYVVRGPCNESCGICGPAMSQLLDAPSNTWSGLRIQNATANLMYAEFRASGAPAARASTNWTELYVVGIAIFAVGCAHLCSLIHAHALAARRRRYDLSADPFQLVNLAVAGRTPPARLAQLSSELFAVATCKGSACP